MQETAVDCRPVKEDRARFENRLACGGAIRIDQHRHLAQGIEGDEAGVELRFAEHLHILQPIVELEHLQQDNDLPQLVARNSEKVDHLCLPTAEETRSGERMVSSVNAREAPE